MPTTPPRPRLTSFSPLIGTFSHVHPSPSTHHHPTMNPAAPTPTPVAPPPNPPGPPSQPAERPASTEHPPTRLVAPLARRPHPYAEAEPPTRPYPSTRPATTAGAPPTGLAAARGAPPRRTRTDAARNPATDAGLIHLAAYLTIVKGTPQVRRSSVQAAAALLAASTSIETANPELCVSVQVSGVNPSGAISWVSLFGSGRLRDPTVIGVQSRIHDYKRGLDGLARAGQNLRCQRAHDVGDYAGGGNPVPVTTTHPRSQRTISELTQEEYLDIMTSPADAYLPPPPGILDEVAELRRQTVAPEEGADSDRDLEGGRLPVNLFPPGPLFHGADLARPVGDGSMASGSSGHMAGTDGPDAARGSSGSAAGSSGPSADSGTGAARPGTQGAPAGATGGQGDSPSTGVLLVESYEPLPAHTPSPEALAYLEELLDADSSPVRTMRAALKSAVLFIMSRVGTVPHKIMSCLGGWWPFMLVRAGEERAVSPAEQWKFGVIMPMRLLCTTRRTRLADLEGSMEHMLERIPSNDSHSSQNDAAASIVLLWDRVPEVQPSLKHSLYAAVSAATRRSAVNNTTRASARGRPSRKVSVTAFTPLATPPTQAAMAPMLLPVAAGATTSGAPARAPTVSVPHGAMSGPALAPAPVASPSRDTPAGTAASSAPVASTVGGARGAAFVAPAPAASSPSVSAIAGTTAPTPTASTAGDPATAAPPAPTATAAAAGGSALVAATGGN